jgi:hypothetical protein
MLEMVNAARDVRSALALLPSLNSTMREKSNSEIRNAEDKGGGGTLKKRKRDNDEAEVHKTAGNETNKTRCGMRDAGCDARYARCEATMTTTISIRRSYSHANPISKFQQTIMIHSKGHTQPVQ